MSVSRVDVGTWGLTWAVDDAGRLRQIGLGPEGAAARLDVDARWYPEAHPTWGGGDPHRPAPLRITHHDGTLTTRLVVDDVETRALDDGEHTVVRCRDEVFDLTVEHHLRSVSPVGMLEQWVEIIHDEPGPVRLYDHDSMAPLLLARENAEVVQFGGSGWADEWRWTRHGLVPGVTSLASFGGVQPHLQRSPCLLVGPSGTWTEHEGEVLGLSICWGGNVRFDLDVRPVADRSAPATLRLRCGANPTGADYVLDPGRRFVTPTVAWTWSSAGSHGVTSAFHEWTRRRVVRDPDQRRPIVVNNWEATFFDFDQQRITDLIDRAAGIGADLFLLDDGWFGTDHPRDDDTQGLGDWAPDAAKLPGGLAPLSEAAAARGLRFGIWVEPEMVNPVSTLHADHPGWVLRDQRDPLEHRNQLVLDPLLPEVREFEAGVVDRALAPGGISYVKWDANRPVTDPGSAALPADRQSNVWTDMVHATWEVMAEVGRRHPDTTLMLCASGGGRTDHGTLRHFHEFWTSDNTDPVERVRMQWACSHFFPASTMAAHVTRWGDRPLAFGCAVALSGRFGLDLDLASLSPAELDVCRRAVAVAHQTQSLVQGAPLHRLHSPVDGDDRSWAALAYIADDAAEAVVFAYRIDAPPAEPVARVRVPGLRPDAVYNVEIVDLEQDRDLGDAGSARRTMSGLDLARDGLDGPERPLSATIWRLAIRGAGTDDQRTDGDST